MTRMKPFKWIIPAALALAPACGTSEIDPGKDGGSGDATPDADPCDLDGDHYVATSCGGDDCDDTNLDVHPGANETCDGDDNDCDGAIDPEPPGARCSAVDFGDFLRGFGTNLRRARWLKGFTQEQVAAHGISHRYYAELERGQRNPTLRTVFELADILGVTVADLVTVPGARASKTLLTVRDVVPPPRGRKPSGGRPRKRRRA